MWSCWAQFLELGPGISIRDLQGVCRHRPQVPFFHPRFCRVRPTRGFRWMKTRGGGGGREYWKQRASSICASTFLANHVSKFQSQTRQTELSVAILELLVFLAGTAHHSGYLEAKSSSNVKSKDGSRRKSNNFVLTRDIHCKTTVYPTSLSKYGTMRCVEYVVATKEKYSCIYSTICSRDHAWV